MLLYRFIIDENGNVVIENGTAFLQDTEFSKTGETIKLNLSEANINKYRDELQYLIENELIINIKIID